MKQAFVAPVLVFLVALFLASGFLRAQAASTNIAQNAADAWLAFIDSQDYASSWNAAAKLFRARITQEQWKAAAQGARAPFGQLKRRTLKSATSTTTLPGAPDGEYVVFQFNTSFEQKAAAAETVTAVLEPDGSWHVAGYFIR
jgi:Protein of unknown function (DUF4019)